MGLQKNYKKITKKFRQFFLIKLINKIKRNITIIFTIFCNILYLFFIKKISNLTLFGSIINSKGLGAGSLWTGYNNKQKLFFKIANRKNCRKKEVPSYKNYYKYEQKHHIKLIDYSYKFLLNYISFQFVNFITLEKFITNKEQHNIKHNFYNNFIFIINNLYQTKTNHNDISLDNIAVIKEDNCYELELFDFGNGDANNPNFIHLFQQDVKNITNIVKLILIQEDYRRFLNYLTKNYPFLKKII